jgi:hypothetical protein
MFDMQLTWHGTIHSLDNMEKWQTEWMVCVRFNMAWYTAWTTGRSDRQSEWYVFNLTWSDTQLGQQGEVTDKSEWYVFNLTWPDTQLGQQGEVTDTVNGMCSRTQTDWLLQSVKSDKITRSVQKQKQRLTALGQIGMFPTWQVVVWCGVYTCKATSWFRQLVSLWRCGFNPKPAHVGFVVDKVAKRHYLSMSSSVFHSPKHSTPAPCSFIHLPLMLHSLIS